MTTAAIPHHTTRQRGLELLVSRLAVRMLRWSQHRANQRKMTHEQMMLLRQLQRELSNSRDISRSRRQF